MSKKTISFIRYNARKFHTLPLTIYFLCFLFLSCSTATSKRASYSSKKSSHSKPKAPINKAKTKTNSRYFVESQIVSEAKKYLGIKYKYGGKNPSSGFDCSGFTSYVLQKVNVNLTGNSNDQFRQGINVPLKKVQPGDLVFFGNGKKISHVSLVTGNQNGQIKIIHSTSSAGVKMDNLTNSNYWMSRFLAAKRIF